MEEVHGQETASVEEEAEADRALLTASPAVVNNELLKVGVVPHANSLSNVGFDCRTTPSSFKYDKEP